MVGERIDQVRDIFGESLFSSRWGIIFVIKMAFWTLMVIAVGVHAFLIGPRQLDLNRQALDQDEAWVERHLRPLQTRSILLSVSGLLLSLLVLGCGTFLGNHAFSFQFA